MSYLDWSTNWALFPFAMLAAGALLWIPGLLIGVAAGVPRRLLAAWAPAGTVVAVTGAGMVAPNLEQSWGVLPVLELTAVMVVFGLAVRGLHRVPTILGHKTSVSETLPATCEQTRWWTVPAIHAALLITAVIGIGVLIGSPGSFPQNWDNAFHLNAIQAIVDTGNASTLNMDVYDPDAAQYYPGAWHDLVSLLVLGTGIPATVGGNALALLLGYLVWPLGVRLLAETLVGQRRITMLAIPLSVIFPQFPFLFLNYGTLYPNLLAVVLLPLALVVTLQVLRRQARPLFTTLVSLAFIAAAMGLAQPNAVFIYLVALFVLTWSFTAYWVWMRLRDRRGIAIGGVAGISALWIILGLGMDRISNHINMIHSMRSGEAFYPPQGSILRGIAELLIMCAGEPGTRGGIFEAQYTVGLGVLTFAGMLIAALSLHKKLVFVLYGTFAVLFLTCFAATDQLRVYLVGIWYCDLPRLTVPLISLTPIFAALAVSLIWDTILQVAKNRAARGGLGCVLAIMLAIIGGLAAQGEARQYLTAYRISPANNQEAQVVDADEYQLFLWMHENLPADAVVAANPWEGGTFAWGVGGTRTIFPKITAQVEPQFQYLAKHLRDALNDPKTCSLIKQYGITYTLDLENNYLWGGSGWDQELNYPGLDGTAESGIGPVVKQYGNAKLVKITACDRD
ncbi:MAG: DUF6541 family protein [Varibaculum sp.]|nr:DUF6541 family protein [Varibaculum sp.]